ncbi:MAG: hypothetical protein R6U46_07070 [Marinilabilia sp.]
MTTASPPGHEYSTMLQHGVTNDRRLTPISPLSAGFPHHLMRPPPTTRKMEKPAGSRLTGVTCRFLTTRMNPGANLMDAAYYRVFNCYEVKFYR